MKRLEDADARTLFVGWPYESPSSRQKWDEKTELEMKHNLYGQCEAIRVVEFMRRSVGPGWAVSYKSIADTQRYFNFQYLYHILDA